MSATHTPGPWVWGKRKLAEVPIGTLYGANGVVICDFGDGTQFYPSEGEMPSEHDAHLIAAAPDMLEALQECEEYFDGRADADCDQDGYIPNAEMRLLMTVRAAIAKAEDRS